jgi:hypothetical protein
MVPSASIGGLWLVCRLDKRSLRPAGSPTLERTPAAPEAASAAVATPEAARAALARPVESDYDPAPPAELP